MDEVERLWSNILSRDTTRIRDAWHTLDADEQRALHAHLLRMTNEDGWTEQQQLSAQAALDAVCHAPSGPRSAGLV